MHTGTGRVNELLLRDGLRHARISCSENLIPSPGQYLLASTASDSPLPDPVFYTDSSANGFVAAPAPEAWTPGTDLFLRGPVGRGFELPPSARRIALVALADSASLLSGLIRHALKQGAAVVLVTDRMVEDLPDEVEMQPSSALGEVARWADWVAFEAARENLPGLKERLGEQNQASALQDAELLIRTPLACGGAADCGVCAVTTKSGWRMACKDGPVFRWMEI